MTRRGDGLLEEMWFFAIILEMGHKSDAEIAIEWWVWDETGDIWGRIEGLSLNIRNFRGLLYINVRLGIHGI